MDFVLYFHIVVDPLVKNNGQGVVEVAQGVKALAAKPSSLNSITRSKERAGFHS